MKKYVAIVAKTQLELENLRFQEVDKSKLSVKGIEIVSEGIQELKSKVLKSGFKDDEDEIHFFKTIKPSLTVNLIYYHCIAEIELKCSYHSVETVDEFVQSKLDEFRKLFDDNADFLRYYKSDSIEMDEHFYKRGVNSFPLFNTLCPIYEDPNFVSSKDLIVANILAYQNLLKYLEHKNAPLKFQKLPWKGTKTDAVEIIYALKYSKTVPVDLIELVNSFNQIFDIELSMLFVYRVFKAIKDRKKDQTKFLDKLKENMLNQMNEELF